MPTRDRVAAVAAGPRGRAAAAAVELTGLHKNWGSVQAVRGVDVIIAPGEVVAVLGPNGAGKSTTIDMLLGLTAPDAGTVRLFGEAPGIAVREGRVGAMLQSGALLPDVTVRELVATFAALHRHPLPVAEALRRAGIADIAGQRTTKLSGGQAQRVRFALALVPDPELLVLDEPTVAMDVEVRRSFWSSMRELVADGRTVLFATHYLEEADDFADRVLVLAGGRVVADGTGAQIKAAVSGRTVSAVIPDVEGSRSSLSALPGVLRVEQVGPRVLLHCSDSDAALRALLAAEPRAHDIEVSAGDLEDAFLALTARTVADADAAHHLTADPASAPSTRSSR
ncbi:ABC transporter ATP-binding protein [Nakamurella endophytica]|uniref:ABC transporter ATP-binding protein n=1 Tax=Nakamurella endophytica TaxID=1748367 RepID=A0A917SRT7_9ACTN|nr:ABC transporter ATP-binding protein [Nakamurella endophytica]GGL95352.1 ABC transporter ATP-binding protein [Nakamurella endophytica]